MFKITIEETKIVKKLVGKDWAIIGSKEVDYHNDNDTLRPELRTRIENVYGHTPEIEKNVEVTNTILIQEVESIDLANVIKAINNL